MEPPNDDELVFEEVAVPGMPVRRIGRSKTSGIVLLQCKYDERGRQIEKCFYADDGELKERIVYEYDGERQPRLTSVFDREGKLIWRHERGKRPEPLV